MKTQHVLGLLLGLIAACQSKDDTMIVVEVWSNLAVLDNVRIDVIGPTATTSKTYPLDSQSQGPVHLALVPQDAKDTSLMVRATGLLDYNELVQKAARVSFVPGESKLLSLVLDGPCAYVACGSSTKTCSAGVCVAVPTISDLPDYDPKGSLPATGGAGIGGKSGGAIATGGVVVPNGGSIVLGGSGGSGGISSAGGAGGSGGGISGVGGAGGSTSTDLPPPPTFTGVPLPCEVVAKDGGGGKCVTAHSTVRVIVPGYSGPLYQLCKGSASSGPSSCQGTAQDILAKDGYADVETHDAFCGSEPCLITKIYDQSGMGNDLEPSPKGGAKTTPDNPSKASALSIRINGHKTYGLFIKPGMGYRTGCTGCTIKKTNGMPLGDEPQTVYMVTSQKDLIDGCCFDYGNAETTSNDDGNGCAEAVYFGGGVVWGTGYGGKPGPWVMADMENGLFAGWEVRQDKNISTNKPLKFDFVTAVVVGDTKEKNDGKGRFALYGADAQGKDGQFGKLTCMYDGNRPEKPGYVPMQKQGSLVLGIAGDNSSGGGGRFYEGATIVGPLVSKTTLALLHAVIVAAKYENAN